MNKVFFKIISYFQIPNLALKIFRSPRIVFYHGVTDRTTFSGIENYRSKHIPNDDFLRQIKFLKSNFKIVSLEKLVNVLGNEPKKAKGMLAITFDDGYQNIFRVAWPILKNLNIPFTIFLPTDFVEKQKPLWVDRLEYAIGRTKNNELEIMENNNKFSFSLKTYNEKIQADKKIREYAKIISDKKRQKLIDQVVERCGIDLSHYLLKEPDYAPLSWNEILKMMNSGLVEIGSHTKSHAIATRLPSEEFVEEVKLSKQLIEKQLNIKCSLFAYPNGKAQDFSEKTGIILKEQNFNAALTTEMMFIKNKINIFTIPRLAMDETQNHELFLATVSGIRAYLRKIRDFLFQKPRPGLML